MLRGSQPRNPTSTGTTGEKELTGLSYAALPADASASTLVRSSDGHEPKLWYGL